MKEKPKDAIEQFETCILLEESVGNDINYRFKAMKNIILLSARMHLFDKMTEYQSKILKIINKVARNDVSDAINDILDAVSKHLVNAIDE